MTASTVDWDGINHSYRPGPELDVHPSVKLHRDADAELDPVTYEVLRHTLWTVNEEHGITIGKVSGSPPVNIAQDFNPSIWTEDGEAVFFGPYIQYLNAAGGSGVKWVMENLGENPGISPGDMFITNDPWIASCHQIDMVLMCPIFWEGEIFCWTTNAVHQYDVGGSTPGSFCPDAVDIFSGDPAPMPPIKIVENGVIRRDLEGEYVRRSRMPYLMALDLRAMVAGVNVATRRILEMIEEYGPATVKAAMYRIIDSSERAFLNRLSDVPDGHWTEEVYVECALPGDRSVYKQVVSLTKEGDTLTFDNRGTDPQVEGALNCTFAGWRGGIVSAISPHFCFDQLFAIGGAERHIRYEPEPGTMTCATYPAAVSTAPIFNVITTIWLANNCIAKMLSASPTQKENILGTGSASSWCIAAMSGTDQWGRPFGTLLLDEVGGGMGALSFRDGVDTGGHYWMPGAHMPNVESNEQFFPILYLWRREVPDSGGAGKFRGGNVAESVYVTHGTDELTRDITAAASAAPTGAGLFGGQPGNQNRNMVIRGSRVRELFAEGRMPESVEELAGEIELLGAKQRNVKETPDDVYLGRWTGSAGYGDALDRDPALVATDVRNGKVTPERALKTYHVVLDDDLSVDAEATARRRDDARRERLENSRPVQELLS